ncbi:MAG TPA: translation initiation factor IF-2 [Rhabdochlamydiaceae bacterium]|nr:translation initiation factor IF-2 [Rhabdochlamydiaceae bacterium]
MAKNLKIKVKNTQLAAALQIGKFKAPPAQKKKAAPEPEKKEEIAEVPLVVDKPVIEKPTAATLPPPSSLTPPVEKKEEAPVPPAPKQAPQFPTRPGSRPLPTPIGRRELVPPMRSPIGRRDGAESATKKPAPRPVSSATTEKKPAVAGEPPKPAKKPAFKEYRDLQPKKDIKKAFDSRDRMGLRAGEDEGWRKRRQAKFRPVAQQEDTTIRPKSLHIRLPITIKDLAVEMKLKASQLIAKLFMQGIVVTLNDFLDDETTVQLLGHEFECEITIDKSEAQRIKVTDRTIKEEISASPPEALVIRPPVVTFMGHVDHGKTSLIDAIRKTNVAAGEAGAITQHIGAFKCHTAVGDITILDTPGHEAFSEMRARGAEVTDIVVLVIAGDEGIREQTVEALNQAREANVPIVVALNKKDKPNFNPELVYRQLADNNLLPEVWGGTTITVNCSAVTGEGIKELLEMLALQAEILELKANPSTRARGTVIESEMHKGLGPVATVLIQNGTLKKGDALVFDLHYARVKTMHDEFGKELQEAGPSSAVKITGLSGLPDAGSEFIVVENDRAAREIAEARQEQHKDLLLQKNKRGALEGLLQKNGELKEKKILNLILRADVQGSLEALKQSLLKIPAKKIDVHVISENVGQISESDIELAATSNATIIGFHTQIESHAERMIQEKKVIVKLHDVIYHAVDDVKALMVNLLDKIPQETEMGSALVKAVFKSSQLGLIAGCMVTEGIIRRNHHIRVVRNKNVIWKGSIASLKKVKEDVREVSKGYECGILLHNFNDVKEGDIIQSYEITYLEQELE